MTELLSRCFSLAVLPLVVACALLAPAAAGDAPESAPDDTSVPREAAGPTATDAAPDGGEPTRDPREAVGEAGARPAPPNPWLVGGVTSGLAAFIIAGGVIAWWRDDGFVGWSWKDTGAFGADTYAGGADKVGHFFAFYLIARASAGIYRRMRVPPTWSLVLGAAFSLLMGNVIEVVDGFTTFGFEYGDAIANSAGIAAAVLLETYPGLDCLVGLRLSYWPSPGFIRGGKDYFKLINDYSGMLFYLDLKPAGLQQWGAPVGPARFAVISLTYGTLDYAPRGANERRNLGVAIGLNVPEILEAVLGPDAAAVLGTATRYYSPPFTNVVGSRELSTGKLSIGFGVPGRILLGGS